MLKLIPPVVATTTAVPVVVPVAVQAVARAEEKVRAMAQQYQVLQQEMTERDREYCTYLDWLIQHKPRVIELRKEQDEYRARMLRLEEEMKEIVRKLKHTVVTGPISVEFCDPKTITYDADKLLENMPQAMEIPDLLRFEINPDVFRAAVAAGKIPQGVEALVVKKVPTTKAGRVEFKITGK